MNDYNKKSRIGTSILLVIFAILMLTAAFWRQDRVEKNTEELSETINEVINKKLSSEFPDFDAIQHMKSIRLASDFESWTPKSQIDPKMVITKLLVNKGELSKAYVLIDVVQQDRPLTKWESVYLKLNNTGGHLFRPQTLAVPESDSTILLYALDDVPYLLTLPYSEQKSPKRVDWFTEFVPNSEIEVISFISSLRKAKIKNLEIYYECLNDSECQVSVKE